MENNKDSSESKPEAPSGDEYTEEDLDDLNMDDVESKTGMGDIVKKVLTAGIGAAFMTEEGIRSYMNNMKLPKDVVNLLLAGANKSKQDMVDRVTDEVVKIIKKIDFVEEASRFVEEHNFKVSAEIEVIKKTKPEE